MPDFFLKKSIFFHFWIMRQFDNFMEKHAQIELSGNTELLSRGYSNLLK